jgi:hypothetical protein
MIAEIAFKFHLEKVSLDLSWIQIGFAFGIAAVALFCLILFNRKRKR